MTLNRPLLVIISACRFFQRGKFPLAFSHYTITLQYLAYCKGCKETERAFAVNRKYLALKLNGF